jgi:predicted protein tyrosine phosphatase
MATKTQLIFLLSAPFDNPYQGNSSRYLFVCSAGLLRSPTAAAVGASLGYNTRSCGCEEYALIPLSVNLIEWAHKIFFMNEENYTKALDNFRPLPEYTEMLHAKSVVWDIEDQYEYGDYMLKQTITKLLM